MTRLLLLTAVLAAAACSPRDEPGEPTPPAPPIDGETAMPGPDAGNFVGSWAARAEWCGNTDGPERPIRITTTRFEGYENSCVIEQVRQMGTAFEVVRTCTGEGMTDQERVRLRVIEDRLTLSFPDRAGSESTEFVRCEAPQPVPAPTSGPTPAAPEPTG